MLQRFFMVMALTLAFTMPSQAISIQELKSSPQFKVVSEVTPDVPNANEHTTWYLDTSSIEVLEYAPPMYKIKALCTMRISRLGNMSFLVMPGLCPMIRVSP